MLIYDNDEYVKRLLLLYKILNKFICAYLIFSILTDMLKIFFICLHRLSRVLFPLYVSIYSDMVYIFLYVAYSCTCDSLHILKHTERSLPRPERSQSDSHAASSFIYDRLYRLYSLFHRCHILSFFI